MSELTEKSSQSEKQKSEGSSQDSEFVDLNDRADAFRLGAQLAAELEKILEKNIIRKARGK